MEWLPIDTAPKGKVILVWLSARHKDGTEFLYGRPS